jgi:hypothetical protein
VGEVVVGEGHPKAHAPRGGEVFGEASLLWPIFLKKSENHN